MIRPDNLGRPAFKQPTAQGNVAGLLLHPEAFQGGRAAAMWYDASPSVSGERLREKTTGLKRASGRRGMEAAQPL